MLDVLIKKSDYTKLQLFQALSTTIVISTQELCTQFYLSRSSTERQMEALNDTLNDLFEATQDTIIKRKNKYYFCRKASKTTIGDFYHTLKLYYLKKSLKFQILVHLMVHPATDIDSLMNTLHVSKPHIYRLLASLEKVLKKFNLEIKKTKGYFEISGNEVVIRTTMLILLSTTYQSIEWPFSQVTKDSLLSTDNRSFMLQYSIPVQHKLMFLLAITTIRLKKNSHLQLVSETNLSSFLIVIMKEYKTNSLFPVFPDQFKLSSTCELKEQALFNFLIRFIIADIDNQDTKIALGKHFMTLNTSVTHFCLLLSQRFFSVFSISSCIEHQAEFMYYAVLYHLAEEYLDTDISAIVKLNHKIPDAFASYKEAQKIYDFYQHFLLHHNKTSIDVSDSFSQFFSHILLLFLKPKQKLSFKIYIYYSKNIIGEAFLKEQISQFFSDQILSFSRFPETADILISDSNYEKNEQVNHFFINDIYDINSLSRLFGFIQKSIFNKAFDYPKLE